MMMKILAFSDLHGRIKDLERLKEKSKEVDLVLCAGDITVMEDNISMIVSELAQFHKPVLLIHGNHEDEYGLQELASVHDNIIFLHKVAYHINDYVFLGFGGGGFSREDPEFKDIADNFFKKEAEGKRRIVLMTHAPPHATKLDDLDGSHRGNKDMRKFIDEVKPHIVICGHFHENAGKTQKIGRTILINPGYNGAVIEI